jgi:hypothetical protein
MTQLPAEGRELSLEALQAMVDTATDMDLSKVESK